MAGTSSEGDVSYITVNQRSDHIHDQDRIADAFYITAAQADQCCKDAKTECVDQPAFLVIGLVTQSVAIKGADDQPAGKQMINGKPGRIFAQPAVNSSNNDNRADIASRDTPVDVSSPEQINSA